MSSAGQGFRKPWLALTVVVALTFAGCGSGESADREFRVRAESMMPTYEAGDTLDVDLDPDAVRRGDVVVIHPPAGAEDSSCDVRDSRRSACPRSVSRRSSLQFVLRVVATAGDRLKVIGGATYINGERAKEGYIRTADPCGLCELPQEVSVPKGQVFLMGDNRGASADSRIWGPVPEGWIIGAVIKRQ